MSIETGVIYPERFEGTDRTEAEERNIAIVKEVFEAYSRTDFAFLNTKTIPDAEVGVAWLTPERIRAHTDDLNFVAKTFTNGMRFEIQNVVVDGNKICVQWHDEAETAHGKIYTNDGLSIFVFEDDGRVRSYLEYVDLDRVFAAI
ncbi:MAG: nuclear transport factor 2 family protein [Candidatus Binatia bacterium]|nr:nuclear transport factor 2 family protein [Candidatus Binatia bacterium]